ncbi:MAG: DUF2723 domain-containing protein [Candidatus Coatesbacteria bacterium]
MTAPLLFLLAFGVSLRLMGPGLALEDAGEFATAAVTLTLTHPPGYPLYLLAGKLAALLPVGSPGFRLACLSAGCSALAAVFVYGCARECLGTGRLAAAGCGLALAWTPAAALQSSLADKYPLNLALLSALIWLCWRAGQIPARRLDSLALLGGISFAHHMTTLYLAPAVLGLAWQRRLWIDRRRLVILCLLGGLGVSLKPVALPLLSSATPSLMYARLDSARMLERYLSAKEYSGRFAAYSAGEKLLRVATTGLPELVRQAGWPLVVLALLGGVALWCRARSPLVAGIAGAGIAVWLVSSFQIAGVGYYLLPVVAFLALLAAGSLARPAGRAGPPVAAALGVLLAAHAGLRSLPAADLSRYVGALDWGRNLLASTPRDGILVTQHDDDFFPVVYAQRVLGERLDVVVIHRPFLTRLWHHAQVEALHPGFTVLDPAIIPWGRTVIPEDLINIFLRSHFGKRPIVFTYLANAECAGGFRLLPDGAGFRVGRAGAEAPLPRTTAFGLHLARFRWRSAFAAYPAKSRFAEVAGAPAASWTQLAARWYDAGDRAEARVALARALRFPYTRVIPEDLARIKSALALP